MGSKVLFYIVCIVCIVLGYYTLRIIISPIMSLLDDPEKRGAKYEKEIAEKLGSVLGVKVYQNIIFNYDDVIKGNYTMDEIIEKCMKETEVDMAFVNTKGIFCIECKSRRDKEIVMRGSLSHPKWRAGFDEFQNPFDQNYKHVKTVYENVVDINVQCVYSIVITNAEFIFTHNGIDIDSKNTPFVNMLKSEQMAALIRCRNNNAGLKEFKKAIDELPDILSDEDVRRFSEILKENVGTKKMIQDHKDHIVFLRSRGIYK